LMHVCKGSGYNFKKTETEVDATGAHLFLNATMPFQPSIGGSQFDAKIVDQLWTAHIKSKAQMQK